MKPISIIIEAGHGTKTPGKRSPSPRIHGGPPQLLEGPWAREIASRLCTALRDDLPSEIDVIDLCPGPVNVPIPAKRKLKKVIRPESTRRGWIDLECVKRDVIHLSIHANAAPGKGWQRPKGSVVFRLDDDNPGSHIFANCILKEMQETIIGIRPGKQYKKPQTKGMAVLKPLDKKRPRLASAMVECGFMTSKRDVEIMNSEDGKRQIVDALLRAVFELLYELGIPTI